MDEKQLAREMRKYAFIGNNLIRELSRTHKDNWVGRDGAVALLTRAVPDVYRNLVGVETGEVGADATTLLTSLRDISCEVDEHYPIIGAKCEDFEYEMRRELFRVVSEEQPDTGDATLLR
jgi:hypothetical protein